MKSKKLTAMLVGSVSDEVNGSQFSKNILDSVGGNLSRLPFIPQNKLEEIKKLLLLSLV